MFDYFKNKYKDGIPYEPGQTAVGEEFNFEGEDVPGEKKVGRNLSTFYQQEADASEVVTFSNKRVTMRNPRATLVNQNRGKSAV